MKLEVGQFVRYKNGIGKIVAKYVKGVLIDKGKGGYFRTENIDIMKASHNIIDLIEEGDYVNGMKVNNIAIEDGLIFLHMDVDECLHEDTMLTGDDIKSIVTKEMFANAEYRVETN